ncbi:MAG: hypothetical protein HY248_00355 [Fimbriimonas ginsengisoli]|nr:hypothetical protein [Fimbriimonas ginsengisoli]
MLSYRQARRILKLSDLDGDPRIFAEINRFLYTVGTQSEKFVVGYVVAAKPTVEHALPARDGGTEH